MQHRWQEMFLMSFVYRTMLGVNKRQRKILKDLTVLFEFKKAPGLDLFHACTTVRLLSGNNVIGESYLDGTGWFMPNKIVHGRGLWQKVSSMKEMLEEYTQVITKTGDRWSPEETIHFRQKPMNLRFLGGTSKKFSDYVATKYAAVGVAAF